MSLRWKARNQGKKNVGVHSFAGPVKIQNPQVSVQSLLEPFDSQIVYSLGKRQRWNASTVSNFQAFQSQQLKSLTASSLPFSLELRRMHAKIIRLDKGHWKSSTLQLLIEDIKEGLSEKQALLKHLFAVTLNSLRNIPFHVSLPNGCNNLQPVQQVKPFLFERFLHHPTLREMKTVDQVKAFLKSEENVDKAYCDELKRLLISRKNFLKNEIDPFIKRRNMLESSRNKLLKDFFSFSIHDRDLQSNIFHENKDVLQKIWGKKPFNPLKTTSRKRQRKLLQCEKESSSFSPLTNSLQKEVLVIIPPRRNKFEHRPHHLHYYKKCSEDWFDEKNRFHYKVNKKTIFSKHSPLEVLCMKDQKNMAKVHKRRVLFNKDDDF
jgi:hypothetical protein